MYYAHCQKRILSIEGVAERRPLNCYKRTVNIREKMTDLRYSSHSTDIALRRHFSVDEINVLEFMTQI